MSKPAVLDLAVGESMTVEPLFPVLTDTETTVTRVKKELFLFEWSGVKLGRFRPVKGGFSRVD